MANPIEGGEAAQVARLESYLRQDPGNPRLLADLADAYLRDARWDDAKRVLAAVLVAEPLNVVARYRLAVAERGRGDVGAALSLLQQLYGEGVRESAVLLEFGRALAAGRDWVAVAATLVPVDAPGLPEEVGNSLWLLRVRALHHLERLEEASADAEAWLMARGAAFPVGAMGALATLFLDCGRADRAEQVCALAGDAVNDEAELLAAVGFLRLGTGDTEGAARHFARSAERSGQPGRARLGLGLAAAMRGDVDTAMAALEQATEAMPDHLGSWHALAWMHLLKRDLAEARRLFELALAKDRSFGDTHGGLALVAALSGDREDALERLRTARRLDPRSMNAAIAAMVIERKTDLGDPELLRDGLRQLLRAGTITGTPSALMIEKLAEALDQRRRH